MRLNPGLPWEFERIINKALEKDRNLRYQHASEMRADLQRMKRDSDTGQSSAVLTEIWKETEPRAEEQFSSDSHLVSDLARRHKKSVALAVVAFTAMLGILTYGIYRFGARSASQPGRSTFETMKVTRITSDGKSNVAVVSPDGKYVVHAITANGLQSLWTVQVATMSNVQIVPPADVVYYGLTFSPDGNYIYFVQGERRVSLYKTLYQLPVLGGVPRKLIADVDSPVAFSPDGSHIAYVRVTFEKGQVDLLINSADGTDERLVSTTKIPQNYYPLSRIAWSADGKKATLAASATENRSTLVEVPMDGGPGRPLTNYDWKYIEDPVWLADGSGLVFAASEPGSYATQLWLLAYPGGQVRRITNDLNSYADVSLTADSGTISATESELSSTLWTAPRGEAELSRRITSNEKDYDGLGGMAWTPDGRILFASYRGGNLDLWISDADGANSRQLTRGPGSNINPAVSADGRTFVFVSTRTGASCLWKMDSDGRNIVQLTRGGSETLPQVSPDGKFVVYQSFATGAGGVWKVPLEGGEPAEIIQRAFHPVISPDGKLLAVTKNRTDPPSYYFEIIPVTGGPSIKQSDYPVTDIGVSPTWSPDGRGLVYLDSREGVGNLWLQPISSGKPKRLTNFTSERIFGFVWSRDGKQLALARGTTSSDIVLIRKFR